MASWLRATSLVILRRLPPDTHLPLCHLRNKDQFVFGLLNQLFDLSTRNFVFYFQNLHANVYKRAIDLVVSARRRSTRIHNTAKQDHLHLHFVSQHLAYSW